MSGQVQMIKILHGAQDHLHHLLTLVILQTYGLTTHHQHLPLLQPRKASAEANLAKEILSEPGPTMSNNVLRAHGKVEAKEGGMQLLHGDRVRGVVVDMQRMYASVSRQVLSGV
jgi:hypothetical protein